MSAGEYRIRPVVEEDWGRLRALRLEMLADTPIAFEERLDQAERRSESDWRSRAARSDLPDRTTLVAEQIDGAWLGTMGCYVPVGLRMPYLVAVYVTPAARGRGSGVAPALLAAAEAWAAARSDTIALEVHEHNPRARAFYERNGYALTGSTRPYPFDPTTFELEMVKRLR